MYKAFLENDLKKTVLSSGFKPENISITISPTENPEFGEYSTNIALQLTKLDTGKGYHSAVDTANLLVKKLQNLEYLQKVEVAGPGFINFYLKNESLVKIINEVPKRKEIDRNILIEFVSPNTAKPLHIGHVRNISLGEALSRLLKFEGNNIFKVSYPSDIGLPIAKALWGVKRLNDEYEKMRNKSLRERAGFLGKAYILASTAYEEDPKSKGEIDEINKKLYSREEEIVKLWGEVRDWSEAYFETIYSRFGTEFDATVWESEVESVGKKVVEENIDKVFIKDQGAIIFPGEKYGLHNRVFITSQGFPTYEAKEIGVTIRQSELFPFDEALHIVGPEQSDYFKVVIQAIEMVDESMKGRKKHFPYGYVTLASGKMSSRKGNVITVEQLIDEVKAQISEGFSKSGLNSGLIEKIAIAAIKFTMLKFSPNTDFIFDIKQSISLQGDSGPYILYAVTRSNSILKQNTESNLNIEPKNIQLADEERSLLRQLEYFEYAANEAARSLQPNLLANYLLNLAKAFNVFYENCPVLKSDKEKFRLALTKKVNDVLASGLYLLGIETVERM